MKDPKITLTTDFLDYDVANRVGYYFNKGTIKDSINTLISDIGYYYLPINEMFFKDSVKVYTPEYTMYSDNFEISNGNKSHYDIGTDQYLWRQPNPLFGERLV